MKKIIYHGSEKEIRAPQYGVGKKYNDYGLGFYCTENIDLAKEWAVSIDHDGYANKYEIDTNKLSILNLNDGSFCIMHWLAVLIENREFNVPGILAKEAKKYILDNFLPDYKKYDAIIGYRADDSYFSFAQDFLNGAISYRQLNNAMRLGNLGEQFVLKSRKSFEHIHFIGSEAANKDDWYPRKENRDRKARREYFDTERNKRRRGDLYVTNILDEEIKSDDPRLR